MSKNNNKRILPGMEEFLAEEEEEYFFEGTKLPSNYFDAAALLDSPRYQPNAEGATTYTLFIVFPSREEILRAIVALTKGQRRGLNAAARIGSLNGIAITKEGISLLEMWERDMLGIEPKKEESDPDEAHAPI